VASPTPGVARVDNLFNPFLPLPDPTAWLLSLPPAQLIDVTEKLKRLLALEEGTRIVADQERGEVTIRMRRTRSSLDELSDGYQSMLVLVCDVMRTVLTTWDTVEQAEGIVLIDELGAHLHPTWRMRIVGALREVLPRMQFIVSTHDPLCLRGLEDGEVIVLRRNERQRIVSLSDLPPVKGLRVDQLLTSEHFGLGSTDDPELDDLFQEYYRLRGVNRRSPKQDVELKRVEARLTALRQFGATDRERMVLQAADTYLARRREEPSDAPPMDEVVKSELATIWERVLPQRRRSQ
jgi:hypothetical protein